MARKIAVNLNLLGNEIKNFVVDATSTAPAGKQGAFYYDITAKALKYHNGTAWITVATGGDASQIADDLSALTLRVDGHDTSIAALQTIVNTPATSSKIGMMSAADKTKLDGIAAGAQVNQNAFSKVKVGTTTIEADSTTDTVELVGNNISLTPDATNDKVTIALPTASSSQLGGVKVGSRLSISSGVLSANVQSDTNFTQAEKTKLAGIATGANNYTLPAATDTTLGGVKVDTAMSSSSTNPVQNKAVKSYVDSLNADLTSRIDDLDIAASNIENKVDTVTGENAITSTVTSTTGDPVVKTAKVALKLDNTGNVTLSQSTSGLKAVAPEYTVEALATAETGYLKTYRLKKGSSYVGASINIPKDFLVKSGSVVSGTWNGSTFTESSTGKDKALKLVIYTKDSSSASDTIYINVKDFVNVYTAGYGIEISDDNKVSIDASEAEYYINTNDPDEPSATVTLNEAITKLIARSRVSSITNANGASLTGDVAFLDATVAQSRDKGYLRVIPVDNDGNLVTSDPSAFAIMLPGTMVVKSIGGLTGTVALDNHSTGVGVVRLTVDSTNNEISGEFDTEGFATEEQGAKADNSVQYTDEAKTQVTIQDALTIRNGQINFGSQADSINMYIKAVDSDTIEIGSENGEVVLQGINTPELDTDAANKEYVDTKVSSGIAALDSEKSGSDTNSQVTVKVSQTDGKLSGVTVTTAMKLATAADLETSNANKLKGKTITATAGGTCTFNDVEYVIPSSIRTYLRSSGGVYTEFIGDISSSSEDDGGWPIWTISWNGLSVSSGDTIVIFYATAF